MYTVEVPFQVRRRVVPWAPQVSNERDLKVTRPQNLRALAKVEDRSRCKVPAAASGRSTKPPMQTVGDSDTMKPEALDISKRLHRQLTDLQNKMKAADQTKATVRPAWHRVSEVHQLKSAIGPCEGERCRRVGEGRNQGGEEAVTSGFWWSLTVL